jgi:hypothetical protein
LSEFGLDALSSRNSAVKEERVTSTETIQNKEINNTLEHTQKGGSRERANKIAVIVGMEFLFT